jgi:hypothetical protein
MYSSISLLPRKGKANAEIISASYQKEEELDFFQESTVEGDANTGINNCY